jgi:small subunit ribosomal protein S16
MVTIRLQRVGRRNHAEFRVVVTESARGPKSSNYIEVVGHHNPHTDTTVIDADKVKAWIAKGAQVSDTVHNILVTKKVIEGKKKNVLPKKTPIVKTEEKKG